MKLLLARFWLWRINRRHPEYDVSSHIPLSARFPNESVKELWERVGK